MRSALYRDPKTTETCSNVRLVDCLSVSSNKHSMQKLTRRSHRSFVLKASTDVQRDALRPIYTVRLCRIKQAHDGPTTR